MSVEARGKVEGRQESNFFILFFCYPLVRVTWVNLRPTEFLNSLTPAGLPPHKHCLRASTPLKLLRNLDPCNGLLHGTRLRIISLGSRLIEAEIMTCKKTGKYVFKPKITLTPSDSFLPFHLRRCQFPIRPAYAMTINKSQGQTLTFVGIHPTNLVFSHGQLYVALSCAQSMECIKMLPQLSQPNHGFYYTDDIVYSGLG